MLKYDAGRYTITMKDGNQATIALNKTEAKALMQKFMWLRLLNIEQVECIEPK